MYTVSSTAPPDMTQDEIDAAREGRMARKREESKNPQKKPKKKSKESKKTPTTRYCGHEDGHCLDGKDPCPLVDRDGYPRKAKRRTQICKDNVTAVDIDTGVRHNIIKSADGTRRWLSATTTSLPLPPA